MTFLLAILMASLSFATGLPMPHGTYAKGSLANAWQLPESGEGFVRLFPIRNSGWGSQPMIEMIERTAIEMNQLFPLRDRLQIGDISSMRGGRISRHRSHQIGLDVDIAYYRLNGIEQTTTHSGRFLEHMVQKGKISKNFDLQRNWELLKSLHRYGRVQRVFVDRLIKKEFCAHAKAVGESESFADVLRSMRPFPHHSNHMHVRLQCPEYANKCIKQPAPSEGTGCHNIY